MSYDFQLMPRDPGNPGTRCWRPTSGVSWKRATVRSPRRGPGEALEQIAGRLQAHDPQLERFTAERFIELSRADNAGLQVSLFSDELAVAVAYWHIGPTARAVMQIAWSYLAIPEQETEWEIYDRQLGCLPGSDSGTAGVPPRLRAARLSCHGAPGARHGPARLVRPDRCHAFISRSRWRRSPISWVRGREQHGHPGPGRCWHA